MPACRAGLLLRHDIPAALAEEMRQAHQGILGAALLQEHLGQELFAAGQGARHQPFTLIHLQGLYMYLLAIEAYFYPVGALFCTKHRNTFK